MRARINYTIEDTNGAKTYSYPIDMKQVKVIEYLDDYVIVEAPASLGLEADYTEDIRNKRDILKATRDATINAPLNGFDVDTPETRENIEGAIEYYDILTSNGTVDLVWTMADNSTQVVTKADLQGAKDGYVIRKAQAFKTYQQEVSEL